MKVLVFGAIGRVDLNVLKFALAEGHAVTALARDSEKLLVSHERL